MPIYFKPLGLHWNLCHSIAGYSLCYDNVGFTVVSRHQGFSQKKDARTITSSFAVLDRVPSETVEKPTVQCEDMNVREILPSVKDHAVRRDRMRVIVERIVVAHVPEFKHCPVVSHIPHSFSEEMARKSETFSFRILDVNPGSSEGSVKVGNGTNRHRISK